LAEGIVNITDKTFEEEVIRAEIPVLVDFWAPWCGPCHIVTPALEYMARNYKGRLKIVKLNIDENQAIAGRYGIMSIPTLLLFNGDKVEESIVGALPQDKIIDIISKHI